MMDLSPELVWRYHKMRSVLELIERDLVAVCSVPSNLLKDEIKC